MSNYVYVICNIGNGNTVVIVGVVNNRAAAIELRRKHDADEVRAYDPDMGDRVIEADIEPDESAAQE